MLFLAEPGGKVLPEALDLLLAGLPERPNMSLSFLLGLILKKLILKGHLLDEVFIAVLVGLSLPEVVNLHLLLQVFFLVRPEPFQLRNEVLPSIPLLPLQKSLH